MTPNDRKGNVAQVKPPAAVEGQTFAPGRLGKKLRHEI